MEKEQLERYGRQVILPELGEAGQQKLLAAKVLIIGCGGLGAPNALYLAAAGVGLLGIADSDKVELGNLHRQVIHSMKGLGRNKAESAENAIKALNPGVKVITCKDRVEGNIEGLIDGYDFIIDCTDNYETRYLINDTCVKKGKPFSHAGLRGLQGQAMTIVPGKGPCFRCLFPEAPEAAESCLDSGVLGTVAGAMGIMQATEAIKYITGIGELLVGKLLVFDALDTSFRKINVKRDPGCICNNGENVK